MADPNIKKMDLIGPINFVNPELHFVDPLNNKFKRNTMASLKFVPDLSQTLICVVCGDRGSGRHYGKITCEGCKGFFKRSVRLKNIACCQAFKNCAITKETRTRCQYCRLQKCIKAGMRWESVQYARKPVVESKSTSSSEERAKNEALLLINEVISGIDEIPCSTMFADIDLDAIIPEECVQFTLDGSEPAPPEDGNITLQYISECASRLLFLSIHWAKNLPAFKVMSPDLQRAVATSSWKNLFSLGLLQCQNLLSLSTVMKSHLDKKNFMRSTPHIIHTAEQMNKIQLFIKTAQKLNLDDYELAALKTLLLFSPDGVEEFGVPVVNAFSELQLLISKQLAEHEYVKTCESEDNFEVRVADMLLLLPLLRTIDSRSVEDLFFINLSPGKFVSLDLIIPFILKLNDDFVFPGTEEESQSPGASCESSSGESIERMDTTPEIETGDTFLQTFFHESEYNASPETDRMRTSMLEDCT